MSNNPCVYVLFGIASRGAEAVCQFFATVEDREQFIKDMPGRYSTMTLTGISYDDFDVENVVTR